MAQRKAIVNISAQFNEEQCLKDIEKIKQSLSEKRGVRIDCIDVTIDPEMCNMSFINNRTNAYIYGCSLNTYFTFKVNGKEIKEKSDE